MRFHHLFKKCQVNLYQLDTYKELNFYLGVNYMDLNNYNCDRRYGKEKNNNL